MNYSIRSLQENELPVLEKMLYHALHVPEGMDAFPWDAIYHPNTYAYIKDFGSLPDDYCLVADMDGRIIGAVWVRLLFEPVKGYGNIDSKTPEFAISVLPDYRGRGIGSKLMHATLMHLAENGYRAASLSVAKDNRAFNLYCKCGFSVLRENADDYIMAVSLDGYSKESL